jgi:hypothetical protein
MVCKFVRMWSQQVDRDIGSSVRLQAALCEIKMRGQKELYAVFDALYKLGLEGCIATDACPVADSGEWEKCPFCE